ncbi:histidinol dehydrogenase [Mycobacteroides abscessus]|nr:histidinol dehydrogenase [Mycobacteroides abscessus]
MAYVNDAAPVLLRRIDMRGASLSPSHLRAALPRGGTDVDAVLPRVRPVVEAVRDRGAEAALDFCAEFDGVRPGTVRVPVAELDRALADLDPAVRDALEVAILRARAVHADQRRQDTVTAVADGATVTERWVPVERVGLYVPGGNAVYPSSVVMNVVPAQTAGVGSLVIASPPQAQFGGLPHPTILAAARLLGVEEVWAVGGAQGVALLAHGGTDTDGAELAPVDMITGPGNIYVTAAKRLCRSLVGIDAEAGPTEIAILADETADPVHVAAGSVVAALRAVRAVAPDIECEVEVDSLEQLDEVMAEGAELVLLDNFPVWQAQVAVQRRDARAPQLKLEASGGLSLETAAAYAKTGVDYLAVGALTHSARVLDIGLDM